MGGDGTGWLSVGAASRMLGLSRTTLLAAEGAGLVAPVRTPGGHRRYRLDELTRYLERVGGRPAPPPAVGAPHGAEPAGNRSPEPPVGAGASMRAALRPIASALDADCVGLYLDRPGGLRFCAAFGVPRWLAERLATASTPPAPVAAARETGRPQQFDPAAAGFRGARAIGCGLAVVLPPRDRAAGVLVVLTRPGRELLGGELRVVDAFAELIAAVVESRRRVGELEQRLDRIAALSSP